MPALYKCCSNKLVFDFLSLFSLMIFIIGKFKGLN